jgi:signal transduction histidine kinase
LPLVFWVQVGVGLFGFIVGAWVLVLRRGGMAETCLFLAGLGLMLSAFAAAVYSSRELALAQGLFRGLSGANHLGALGFGAAMICLFLRHPVPLTRRRGMMVLPGAVLGAWWLGNQLRLLPDPATGFQLPVALALLGIAACIGLQWRAARGNPLARAQLRWFGLAVLTGAGAFIATIILPVLLGAGAALPQGLAFLFFLPIYGGLALGVARYRLFELEDWAFRILFYLGGMLVLLALDAVLVLLIAVDRGPAFGLSLLVVALLYLPLRDGLARRLSGGGTRRPGGQLFRAVTDVALSPTEEAKALRWRALLQAEFDPLRIEPAPRRPDRPQLAEDGAALDLPAIGDLPALRLAWARGGRGLFALRDEQHAAEIVAMLTQASASRRAYETGVAEERARIAQDMHDNIGIQLMGALHSPVPDRKDALIRETLSDLRDIISNANRPDQPLADLLADLRASLGEHLSAAGVALDWAVTGEGAANLPPRHAHALRSILREAVGNALRHARAARVQVRVDLRPGLLHLSVQDDGRGLDPALADGQAAGRGNGLANMRARAAGLGGRVVLGPVEGGGTRVEAELPLPGQDSAEERS